ncbi:rod shape-determining protein MreC [Comamonas humi]
MPTNSFDSGVPTFRQRGPSPLIRLAVYGALALFLMVADVRFKLTEPVRRAVAAVLYPLQWVMMQPVQLAHEGARYFESLTSAQDRAQNAEKKMTEWGLRANQVETMQLENQRLRALLDLRPRLTTSGTAAQVIYETADAYTRRVVIDKGEVAGIERGSPVMDELGVLGQVTRVFAMTSEVTLVVDREQSIPVLNPRTGARGVAYGDPLASSGGGMELRFMPSNADIQEGDLLTTSGVDGVYAPGLPVAKIVRIERKADSQFSRVYCEPLAQVHGVQFVMVLKPLGEDALPAKPPPPDRKPDGPASTPRKGRKG